MTACCTHDLLRLRLPIALVEPAPAWVEPALRAIPWVVVRRDHHRDGLIPVGVRGPARSQRFAATTAASEIVERLAPEELTITVARAGAVPARLALDRVAPILVAFGEPWGPGGSVGFELATGVPIATPASDLDLIVRRAHRLDPREARDLLTALAAAAAPTAIDVVLETPAGGVALAELAAMPARLLVRTPDGPRLCGDPWGAP